MSVDPESGVLSWGSPVGGIYPVVVAAFDPSGAGATQGFTLTVRVNQPPQILSVDPPTQARVGDLYRYDLRAQDPNGDPLSYALVTGPEQSQSRMACWVNSIPPCWTTAPIWCDCRLRTQAATLSARKPVWM